MYTSAENAYNQYLKTAVYTASKEKLLLMLYDGLVNDLKKAIQAIERKDVPDAHKFLMKGQDIIKEFMRTLRMEYEISASLNQLYDYMLRRLCMANMQKDPAIVEEVLGIVTNLRSVWASAAEQLRTSDQYVSQA